MIHRTALPSVVAMRAISLREGKLRELNWDCCFGQSIDQLLQQRAASVLRISFNPLVRLRTKVIVRPVPSFARFGFESGSLVNRLGQAGSIRHADTPTLRRRVDYLIMTWECNPAKALNYGR